MVLILQNTLSNADDKNTFGQHSQFPSSTYSLFNPMWSARTDDQLSQSNNTNPLAVLTQQVSHLALFDVISV